MKAAEAVEMPVTGFDISSIIDWVGWGVLGVDVWDYLDQEYKGDQYHHVVKTLKLYQYQYRNIWADGLCYAVFFVCFFYMV